MMDSNAPYPSWDEWPDPEVRMARIEYYLAAIGRLCDGFIFAATWTEPDDSTMFYPSERGNGYMVTGLLDDLIAHHDPESPAESGQDDEDE